MMQPKGGKVMQEYTTLFNAITDALAALEAVRADLIAAQQKAEKIFIEAGE